ncbi:MAG: hypothetical protein NVS1B11_26590 [Terriglobales bacterium]
MPELPDITAYLSALEPRILGQPIQQIRLASPFLLRTAEPPHTHLEGRVVRELRRIGKRIVIGVEGDLLLVLHLMIAGRLHWRDRGAKLGGRQNLAAFDFPNGTLVITEAGAKHRASLHVFSGEKSLRSVDAGGIEVLTTNLESFRDALTAENRTLKRALTDPRILSGIGNAYSDEILHAAQLSPIALTQKLGPGDWERLFAATILLKDRINLGFCSRHRVPFKIASKVLPDSLQAPDHRHLSIGKCSNKQKTRSFATSHQSLYLL